MDRIHEMIMCLNQILKLRYYLANHLSKSRKEANNTTSCTFS